MAMKRALRQEWVKAGYGNLMGSAEVTPPPPSDWLRVYHLTSAEFAINDLSLGRLKVARFSDLNDPFELLSANFRAKPTRRVVRTFKDAYDSHTGLLCFSSNWTSPIIWSHYGHKHRGICLGFDLKRSLAERVSYEDNRIQLAFDKTENPERLSESTKKQLLSTKYKSWEYEQEIRLFVSLDKAIRQGSLYFYPFGRELKLKEVILGPLCETSLNSVRQLSADLHPSAIVFKSRLAFKRFNVVPDERSVP